MEHPSRHASFEAHCSWRLRESIGPARSLELGHGIHLPPLGRIPLQAQQGGGIENVTDLLKGEDQLDVSKPVQVVGTD